VRDRFAVGTRRRPPARHGAIIIIIIIIIILITIIIARDSPLSLFLFLLLSPWRHRAVPERNEARARGLWRACGWDDGWGCGECRQITDEPMDRQKRLRRKGFAEKASQKRLRRKGFAEKSSQKRLRRKGFAETASQKRLRRKVFAEKASH
jgi:hypothetical protein